MVIKLFPYFIYHTFVVLVTQFLLNSSVLRVHCSLYNPVFVLQISFKCGRVSLITFLKLWWLMTVLLFAEPLSSLYTGVLCQLSVSHGAQWAEQPSLQSVWCLSHAAGPRHSALLQYGSSSLQRLSSIDPISKLIETTLPTPKLIFH